MPRSIGQRDHQGEKVRHPRLNSATPQSKGARVDPPHAGAIENPVFAEPKYVGRPNIPDRTKLFKRFNDVLDRAWLTNNGPFVQEFEKRIAAVSGVGHCVAVSNGTMALSVAAQVLGLTGEVIMPALTFIATPHAFAWQGLQPVFADADSETCCIDPDNVESLITPHTSAIVGVHLWGRACDVDRLEAIARRHGLKLLFDASHAFSCTANGKPIGGFGDVETFSFHATKFVSSVEGGAIVTNDDAVAERLRIARNFGFSGVDTVSQPGTNAKLNELSAAFGLTSLETIDELTEHNRLNCEQYAAELESIPGIRLIAHAANERSNYQYVVVRVSEAMAGISRDDLVAILHQNNIFARRYFFPGCHRSEPYSSQAFSLPVTDRILGEVLTLPTGTAVSQTDVSLICHVLRSTIVASRAA